MDDSQAARDAQKLIDRYSLDALSVLQEILATLQKSNIVPQGTANKWIRFWNRYKGEAGEYDDEMLRKFREDMDTSMIFSGLFSAVTATIASISISTLSPDPNVTTQALLQAIALSLSNSTSSSSPTLQLAVWNGPGTTVIWVQSLLYASLACSLFAALGAVMGKQWLNRYSSIGERGTIADRCKDRQRKLEGLQVWHFRTVLELLPILLQASLLLFGTSICGYMWSQQRTVGAVLIVANSIGALFYFSVIILSLLYPNCPFYSPLSDMLRRFVSIFPYTYVVDLLSSHYSRLIRSDGWISVVDGWTKLLRVASGSSKQCTLLAKRILTRLRRVFTRTYGTHATPGDQEMAIQQPDDDDPAPSLLDLNRPMESIADNSARPGLSEGSIAPHSVVLHKLVEAFRAVTRLRSVDGTEEPRSVDMAVVLWLLQTSTDPNVHADALQVIPEISWPRSTLTSLLSWSMVDLLLANLAACFQPDGHGKLRLNSSSKENVLAIGSAFLFVYWEKHVNDTNTAETVAWTHRAGRPFVQKHADMIDALRDLTRSDDYVRHEERQIICLVYLTIGPGWGKRYTPGLPGYSPMSTTTEALCARTILYLAQVSHAEQWDATSDILLLLDALGGCRNYATSDEFRNMSLMAMGMMLGFRRGNQILSSDIVVDEGWRAARCALEMLRKLVQWKWSSPDDRELPSAFWSWLPRVDNNEWLEILSRFVPEFSQMVSACGLLHHPMLSHDDYLDMCVYVGRASFQEGEFVWRASQAKVMADLLRLSARSLTELHPVSENSFPSHSSELDRAISSTFSPTLIAFLCSLRSIVDEGAWMDKEVVWHATADAFLLLSCTTDIWTAADNGDLLGSLDWAMQVSVPGSTWKTPEHPLFRLQSAALCLMHSLIEPPQLISTQHSILQTSSICNILDFSVKLCSTVAAPDHTLSGLDSRANQLSTWHVFNRDKTFVDILSVLSRSDMDTWMNDPRNSVYVRHWLYVLERWSVPHGYFHESRVKQLSSDALLTCERLWSPSEDQWHDAVVAVQRLAVVVVWREWVVASKAVAVPDSLDILVRRTIQSLKLEARTAVDVESYLDQIQECIEKVASTMQDPSLLVPVRSALEEALAPLEVVYDQLPHAERGPLATMHKAGVGQGIGF